MAQDYAPEGFDSAAIERLRLAAEEVAWLTGRGYSLDVVKPLVTRQHTLSAVQSAALARGTCSEPQYRRRAARELEPEDIARRPIAVDAVDLLATVEAALVGQPLLQTLDGTVRALASDRSTWTPGAKIDEAIDRMFAVLGELKPSRVRIIVGASPAATALAQTIEARAESAKTLKAGVDVVADAAFALKKERQIASGDAEVLDVCAAWFNLGARIVGTLAGARVIRLQ